MNKIKKIKLSREAVTHFVHFVLTAATFGLWAPVWWYCVFRDEIKRAGWTQLFDNDYWDYIVERDEPPAALHPTRFDLADEVRFEA